MKFVLFLLALGFVLPASAANIFCSAIKIAPPDPADPICSVIDDRGLTGTRDEVLAALVSPSGESCKRDEMSGKEIRGAIDATEYQGLDSTEKQLLATLTSGGEDLDPYGFGVTALTGLFPGSGATLTALAVARVQNISIADLYGLSPRAIDVQVCQEGQ